MSDKLCAKCKTNPATSNGYCKSCNAERLRIIRQPENEHSDTLSLAADLDILADPAVALFADTLTDAQAIFLLERIYGPEVARVKIKLLMEEGRLE